MAEVIDDVSVRTGRTNSTRSDCVRSRVIHLDDGTAARFLAAWGDRRLVDRKSPDVIVSGKLQGDGVALRESCDVRGVADAG